MLNVCYILCYRREFLVLKCHASGPMIRVLKFPLVVLGGLLSLIRKLYCHRVFGLNVRVTLVQPLIFVTVGLVGTLMVALMLLALMAKNFRILM